MVVVRLPRLVLVLAVPTAAPTALYRADVSLTLDGLNCSQFGATSGRTLASAVASLVAASRSGDVGDMACVDAARRRLAADDDDDEAAFAARHGAAGARRRLGADDSADISMTVAVSEDAGVSGAVRRRELREHARVVAHDDVDRVGDRERRAGGLGDGVGLGRERRRDVAAPTPSPTTPTPTTEEMMRWDSVLAPTPTPTPAWAPPYAFKLATNASMTDANVSAYWNLSTARAPRRAVSAGCVVFERAVEPGALVRVVLNASGNGVRLPRAGVAENLAALTLTLAARARPDDAVAVASSPCVGFCASSVALGAGAAANATSALTLAFELSGALAVGDVVELALPGSAAASRAAARASRSRSGLRVVRGALPRAAATRSRSCASRPSRRARRSRCRSRRRRASSCPRRPRATRART